MRKKQLNKKTTSLACCARFRTKNHEISIFGFNALISIPLKKLFNWTEL